MAQTHYDYIIAGMGCAGLSLAMHLMERESLRHKTILLVDENPKNQNDRTWCYWEKGSGFFEPIVFRQWEKLSFFSDHFSKALRIDPYRYKMIRGIDFYAYCLAELRKLPNITIFQGRAENVFSGNTTGIVAGGQTFTATYLFNSILPGKPKLEKNNVWLLQHFKGWIIDTTEPAFNALEATLMDFRTPQKHGTAFCYVLPFSSTRALVEYTLFTPALLPPEEYDNGLKTYISEVLKITAYTVEETEFGVIPMTDYRFPRRDKNIVNIGTAGGQTKGSSGYTFSFIQQHSRQLAESLATVGHPFVPAPPARYHFYDSVLLHVLARDSVPGNQIFATLFKKNKTADVLAFLNNTSGLTTELQLIAGLPTLPFLKAAIGRLM